MQPLVEPNTGNQLKLLTMDYPNLYEKFQAVRRGEDKEFFYQWSDTEPAERFTVQKNDGLWYTITREKTGKTAKAFDLRSSIDFQGVGACLIKHECNLLFNKEGEIVSRS